MEQFVKVRESLLSGGGTNPREPAQRAGHPLNAVSCGLQGYSGPFWGHPLACLRMTLGSRRLVTE